MPVDWHVEPLQRPHGDSAGRVKARIRFFPDFDEPLLDEVKAAFRGEGE